MYHVIVSVLYWEKHQQNAKILEYFGHGMLEVWREVLFLVFFFYLFLCFLILRWYTKYLTSSQHSDWFLVINLNDWEQRQWLRGKWAWWPNMTVNCMCSKGTLKEKYLEKKKISTNRPLNMYHEEVKDKGKDLEGRKDSQERKGIVKNYAYWRISWIARKKKKSAFWSWWTVISCEVLYSLSLLLGQSQVFPDGHYNQEAPWQLTSESITNGKWKVCLLIKIVYAFKQGHPLSSILPMLWLLFPPQTLFHLWWEEEISLINQSTQYSCSI